MGLLDDAIREHLELKRRHGAAEDEVRRQEQEALGPPRRGEVPEPLSPPAAEAGEQPLSEEAGGLRPEIVPGEAGAGEGPLAEEPTPPADDFDPAPVEQETWLESSAEPPAAAYAASAAEEAVPPDEDVLEETPEFLQETPEHDRLWFEQKPPKDFDFDK